ncbi:MAG: ComEC/Rec2 family competence protein [Candidatus Saccharibacteria bacterium]|nr:ComEC/Rec2 family competence protein [Candidatus Saccharibacteria bacterium]
MKQRCTTVRLPLVYGVVACGAGILIGALLARVASGAWFASWVWLVVWGVLLLLLLRWRFVWSVVLLCMVGMLLGYTRGNMVMAGMQPAVAMYGHEVLLEGVVSEDVTITKRGDAVVRLAAHTVQKTPVEGIFWVVVSGDDGKRLQRSDIVQIQGRLQEGFGTYAGAMYRAKVVQVQREVGRDPFVELRDWLSGGIHQQLASTEAALGAGYVLGQKSALPPDFDEALRTVGLTHVVVASGYNLTILVRFARRLFGRVSRYAAALAGGSMAAMFIGITGLSPSMMRAGMVAGISLLAWYYGRQLHPLVLLLVTAAISVLVQPSYIWGDVGWLLSFAAFAGVMLCAPVLQSYFFGDAKPGALRQIVGETLSAQVYTAPIILVMFGTFSNVALLANILVLPLVPLAMVMVAVTGLASLWIPMAAGVVAWPTQALLQYMTMVVDTLAAVPWAATEWQVGWQMAVAMYVVLAIVTIWLYRRSTVEYRAVNVVE